MSITLHPVILQVVDIISVVCLYDCSTRTPPLFFHAPEKRVKEKKDIRISINNITIPCSFKQ